MLNARNKAARELDLLLQAADALTLQGVKAEVIALEKDSNDATLKVRQGKRTFRFHLEAKSTVTRSTIGTFLFRHRRVPADLVLVTEYVAPSVADELRQNQIQFLDASGNAFLQRDGLYVFITGRKHRPRFPLGRPARAFQRSGLELIFALLCNPEMENQTFRAIASSTGVALGTVHWVIRDLRDLGFVFEVRGRRRLIDRQRLVTEWTEAYNRVLRPKLVLGRFRGSKPNWWSTADIRRYGAVWGGEVAAAQLTHSIKPGAAGVYAPSLSHDLIVKNRLEPDPEGSVEIRRRFWKFDDEWNKQGVTPPLLTYADLIAAGDSRSVEAARIIHKRYLSGPVGKE
jgi:hypothetical protein